MRLLVFSWLFLMAIYTLFLTISVFGASAPCFGNQQSLLLQLKNNLTFDPSSSTKLVKWNPSADCCSWEGITCNEGRVIGLDLADEYISGGIDNSSTLFSLQHLESLSLAYNNFGYLQEIPSEFDKLANLSYLNLSNTGFAGQIPIAISRLTRLVTLDLSSDYYYDYELKLENPNLKVLVQNLSELMELHLDGVHISARGNEWCRALSSSLPNLRVLSLSFCNLSGPIDPSLQNLRSLSIIHLNYNDFSASVPDFFADFKNLTSLKVIGSGLNGKFPEKIFQVPTLQTLDLSDNYDLQGSLPEFPPNGSLQTMVLSGTSFSGTLPSSMGSLTQLKYLDISYNKFSGSIPGSMGSLTQLKYLDISHNKFSGSIPGSMGSLTQLKYLRISRNKFSGSIPNFSMCKNLTFVSLYNNDLSGEIISTQWEKLLNLETLVLGNNLLNGNIPDSLFSHPSLQQLYLSDNQFSGQLKEFSNASSFLEYLYLDNNHLEGPIPMSISELHGLRTLSLGSNNFNNSLNLSVIQHLKNLSYLDVSHTSLLSEYNDFNFSLSSVPLEELILASCKLKNVPNFLRNLSNLSFLDLSNNQIHGEMSTSIGQSFASIRFLFLSSNKIYGSIPISICNATNLELLVLSNNSISGTIPQCLIEMSGRFWVLDLRRNNLNGTIPDAFPDNCGLQTLSLNKNQLEGRLPKSLANCSSLEILDIGNNHIEGTFPFFLKNTTTLSVLVLRSNKFYGSITHPELNLTWPGPQIVDIASNNFTGNLPIILLLSWTSMMDHGNEVGPELDYLEFYGNLSYQDTITITRKGLSVELEKILTFLTVLDFSCNNFDGHIPKEIGELKLLYSLNLSHNAFTGEIPTSLGKLSHLESLDLSSNKLSGEIPVQLANGLIFLSVLNLSFNQLVGQIPLIKQFSTFSATSFEGNERLCGFPLKSKCIYEDPQLPPPTYEESHRSMIEWNYISAEIGFVFGFGIIIGPLMFWRRWRIWYYKHVDDIMFKIFPQLCLRKEHHQRRAFRNQEPMH